MALFLSVGILFSCKESEPEAALSVKPESVAATSCNAYETTLNVSSNVSWTAKGPDWVTLKPAKGDGSASVVVTVSANVDPKERSGEIVFTYDGSKTVKVSVSQPAAPVVEPVEPALSVEPSSVEAASAASEEFTLKVVSNVAWSAVAPDWVTLSPASSNGDASVKATVSANESIASRNGEIVFTYDTSKTVKVSVSQPAKPRGIASAADFAAWAGALAAGSSTEVYENASGEAILTADIDMTGVNWTPVALLPEGKVFNGQDHAIKNWTSEGKPLFQASRGVIENLVLDSSCKFSIRQDDATVFVVDSLYKTGVLKKVTNNASMEKFTEAVEPGGSHKIFHVAFMAHYMNGYIEDCVNNGNIEIDIPSTTGNIWVSGIANFGNANSRLDADGAVLARGCTNNGNISVKIAGTMKFMYIGGVIGGTTVSAYASMTSMKGLVTGCVNNGSISYTLGSTANGSYINIGGVTGTVEGRVENCENKGDVTVSIPTEVGAQAVTRPAVGGVAGFVRAGIKGCKNSGNVSVSGFFGAAGQLIAGAGCHTNPSFGGVVGQYGSNTNAQYLSSETTYNFVTDPLEDCHNSGKLTVETSMPITNKTNLFAGGVVGFTCAPVQGCDNTGEVSVKSRMYASYAGGVVAKLFNSCENCWNSAPVSLDMVYSEQVSGDNSSLLGFVGGVVADQNQANYDLKNLENRARGNVTYRNGYTTTTLSYAGGVVGRCAAALTSITGCKNAADIDAKGTSAMRAGGISGMTNAKEMSDCHNTGNVTAVMNDVQAGAGGLCGFHTYNGTVLSNCSTSGKVTASGANGGASQFIGGVGNTGQTWDGCTIDGELDLSGDIVGGYILGRFVNASNASLLWTVGATSPMKIKSTAKRLGTAVSDATTLEGNLIGSLNGASSDKVAIASGGVVIE